MQMWRRYCWCLAIILIIVSNASSLKITEVEINPLGSDSEKEWIEFFSDKTINLGDYKIMNNDGNEIILEGEFEEYFVYNLKKQWLDNSDEKIYLYQGDELIFETDIFKDAENNDKTWSLCDKWNFDDNSKGEENNCKNVEKIENNETEEKTINKENVEDKIELVQENKSEEIKNNSPSIIYLSPKSIKTSQNTEILFESKNEKIKKYGFYAFTIFCILVIILLLKEKNGQRKQD